MIQNKQPAILIKNLYKEYWTGNTKKIALGKINLKINQGDFFGLLGHNGAGKSTLINIISGVCIKTSGTVAICGHDIDLERRKATEMIGIVNQEDGFVNFLTVRESVMNYMGFYGIQPDRHRVNEILDILGLVEKSHNKISTLSGGMKRRLMIAKALISNPKVIILDEPTAGVDLERRNSLWKYIKTLNKDLGITILLTTHYMDEAEKLCNKIAIINKGQILKKGSTHSIVSLGAKKSIEITINDKKITEKKKRDIKESIEKLDKDIETYFLNTQQNDHVIMINYAPKNIKFENIMNELRRFNIEIIDIVTKEANLEDVYNKFIYEAASC